MLLWVWHARTYRHIQNGTQNKKNVKTHKNTLLLQQSSPDQWAHSYLRTLRHPVLNSWRQFELTTHRLPSPQPICWFIIASPACRRGRALAKKRMNWSPAHHSRIANWSLRNVYISFGTATFLTHDEDLEIANILYTGYILYPLPSMSHITDEEAWCLLSRWMSFFKLPPGVQARWPIAWSKMSAKKYLKAWQSITSCHYLMFLEILQNDIFSHKNKHDKNGPLACFSWVGMDSWHFHSFQWGDLIWDMICWDV